MKLIHNTIEFTIDNVPITIDLTTYNTVQAIINRVIIILEKGKLQYCYQKVYNNWLVTARRIITNAITSRTLSYNLSLGGGSGDEGGGVIGGSGGGGSIVLNDS